MKQPLLRSQTSDLKSDFNVNIFEKWKLRAASLPTSRPSRAWSYLSYTSCFTYKFNQEWLLISFSWRQSGTLWVTSLIRGLRAAGLRGNGTSGSLVKAFGPRCVIQNQFQWHWCGNMGDLFVLLNCCLFAKYIYGFLQGSWWKIKSVSITLNSWQ